ncbi:hypothetical protein SBA2_610012 [Acidobacteriia bacterium SbA2]|nr:hypothetical protein SBA2_610012 [Acidobacteriia bacterium SbA2]
MGHNLSALRACESSSEKHLADGGRLRLTPVGRCPRPLDSSPSGIAGLPDPTRDASRDQKRTVPATSCPR